MLNPFASNNSGSYFDLKQKIVRKIKLSKVDEQVFTIIQGAYEEALKSEHIVLSKMERKRLKADVSAQFLDDLAKQMKTGL